MEELPHRETLHFDWKIVRSKTFAVAFYILILLINIAMIYRKSIAVEWKMTKLRKFSRIQ